MITKRFNLLKIYIKGKKVLDLGCADFYYERSTLGFWAHRFLVEHAEEVIGLDIAEDAVKELAKRGYKVRYGNVENFDINTKFDVIFAGELIEHIEDFRGFLESCKNHMKPESKLIITTPNCFSFVFLPPHLLKRKVCSITHNCWFDEQTLSHLLKRHGLVITEIKYIGSSCNPRRPLSIISCLIGHVLPRLRPTLFVVASLER